MPREGRPQRAKPGAGLGRLRTRARPQGPHHACWAGVSLLAVPQPQTLAKHPPDSAPERPQPRWEVLPWAQSGTHPQPLLQVTMGQRGQAEDLSRPGRGWRGRAVPRGCGSSLCPGVGRPRAPLLFQGLGPRWARPSPVVGARPLPSLPGLAQSKGVEALLSRGSPCGRGCMGQGA